MKAGIILPSYLAEKTIASVLADIRDFGSAEISEILIIDNCSEDQSINAAIDAVRQDPYLADRVRVLVNRRNYGYGSSIKLGMMYFLGRDVDYVGILHADYQVSPAHILGNYLKELSGNDADVVLSSRFTEGSDISHYSPIRRIGNYFFNTLTWGLSGYRMSDAGTAMFMAKREILAALPIGSLSNTWHFHPQLNILFHQVKGIRIVETQMDWSDSEAPTTVKLVQYGLTLVKILALFFVKKSVLRLDSGRWFRPQALPEDCQTTSRYPVPGTFAGQEQPSFIPGPDGRLHERVAVPA